MIQLKRQQVKAMLDIMSKGDMRPQLENAKALRYNDKLYLTGTDGYVLFMLELEDSRLEGRAINRTHIERWYKLANGKDYLTEEVLYDMEYTDDNFPDITSIVDNAMIGKQTDKIAFNANYTKIVQTLFNTSGISLKLNGNLGALVYEHNNGDNNGYGIIMPLKG